MSHYTHNKKKTVLVFCTVFLLFTSEILSGFSKTNIHVHTDSGNECLKYYTDVRDGQIYPIVKIGHCWWFAANINFITKKSKAFIQNTNYPAEWGRLYPFSEIGTVYPKGWSKPNLKPGMRNRDYIATPNRCKIKHFLSISAEKKFCYPLCLL
jgi:hypothetical protein